MIYSRVVASKFDKDSFITVMPETFGPGNSYNGIELFHPYGFASRPIDRDDENNACSLLSIVDGPQGYAMLLNDGRIQSLLPEIKQGESFQYGPTGNFVRCHADGRVSMFTTDDATVNGRTVALTIGPTGLSFNYPYGKLVIDDTGFHYSHNSGARLDMGAIAAPAPLNFIPNMSYATLSGTVVHVEGTAVHVGTAGGVPQSVALATSVLALCSALNGVLTAIGSPGGIVAPPSGGPCTAGPALVTALSAANAALATAATTLPSVSSTATGI